MKGGKKIKTDKAEEIWFRLQYNECFKNDVLKLQNEYSKKLEPRYFFQREALLKKYGVMPTPRINDIFDAFVFGVTEDTKKRYYPVRLQTPSPEEIEESKRMFVKLWIFDGVSCEELCDYVQKNWKKIRALLAAEGMPKIQRVRKIKNKEKTSRILELDKLSTKEIRSLCGEDSPRGVYREILIQRILHHEGQTASSDAIKMVISRFRGKVK
ncbi:MAG: hypothetical protein WC735_04765 [Candidatus Paceibacterota bacterium]|jgi:hypothetical protein